MKWKRIRHTKQINFSALLGSLSPLYPLSQMPSRAFTAEHRLKDAEDLYLQSVYRFRKAEKSQSMDYRSARREMNRLEAELLRLRQYIYSQSLTYVRKRKKMDPSLSCCPKPAWSN